MYTGMEINNFTCIEWLESLYFTKTLTCYSLFVLMLDVLVAVRLLGVEGAQEACGQREEALVRHLHVALSDVQRLHQRSRA